MSSLKVIFIAFLMISVFVLGCSSDEEKKTSHFERGLAHFGLGDINLAGTTVARAVELDPAYVNARLLLAEIYLRKRDFALAQEQALEILIMCRRKFIRGRIRKKKPSPDTRICSRSIRTRPNLI